MTDEVFKVLGLVKKHDMELTAKTNYAVLVHEIGHSDLALFGTT